MDGPNPKICFTDQKQFSPTFRIKLMVYGNDSYIRRRSRRWETPGPESSVSQRFVATYEDPSQYQDQEARNKFIFRTLVMKALLY